MVNWREEYELAVAERDDVRTERNALKSEVERLRGELTAEQERADRLYKDRYDLLATKTTDGLSAAEWQMRTATAEGSRDAALRAIGDEARLRGQAEADRAELIEALDEILAEAFPCFDDGTLDRELYYRHVAMLARLGKQQRPASDTPGITETGM